MTSYVVIGANYGDEGKGLITDYLVRRERAGVVCRFNGGAQAGHTVVLSTGKSHVFSHIGAGFLAGANTYLARRFIVNPLLLERELEALRTPSWPKIWVNPDARVSTIYDMLINAAIEKKRGQDRHGSCGLGINETVTRSAAGHHLPFSIVKQANVAELAELLEDICDNWVPGRLSELGLDDIASDITTAAGSVITTRNFKAHAKAMQPGLAHLGIIEDEDELASGPVVFEGAQGLAIDEFLGGFPHVTRSITGLPYAIEAAHAMNIEELTPIYVTRAYATRHGAGPLPYEGVSFTKKDLADWTNVPNEWQGTLRYAPLDLVDLAQRIKADESRSQVIAHMLGVKLNHPQIAVTCLDQVGSQVGVVRLDREVTTVPTAELPALIGMATGVTVTLGSYGPTRDSVVHFSRNGV